MSKTALAELDEALGMCGEPETKAPCHAIVEKIEALQKEALQYLDQLLGSQQKDDDACRAIDRGRVDMLALRLSDIRFRADEIVRQLNMLSQRIG